MNASDQSKIRPIFTDGLNSLVHFLFGWISNDYLFIAPLFLIYQIITSKANDNTGIDVEEYMLGFLLGYVKKRRINI